MNIKIYTTIVAFFLASLCLVAFVIYPILNSIKGDAATLFASKSGLASLENKINSLTGFSKNYDEYQRNLEKIGQMFINSGDPVDFIKFLEKISSDAGVSSDVTLPGNGKVQKGKDGWPYVVFQIKLAENSENILKFTQKLEYCPYLLKVQNLSIEKTDDPKQFNATFIVMVFAK